MINLSNNLIKGVEISTIHITPQDTLLLEKYAQQAESLHLDDSEIYLDFEHFTDLPIVTLGIIYAEEEDEREMDPEMVKLCLKYGFSLTFANVVIELRKAGMTYAIFNGDAPICKDLPTASWESSIEVNNNAPDFYNNPLISLLEGAIPKLLLDDYKGATRDKENLPKTSFEKRWCYDGETAQKVGAALDYYFKLQGDLDMAGYAAEEAQKEVYTLTCMAF